MSAFLLRILLASWRAAQEEAVGAGVGRTAVTSGPAALREQDCRLPVVREFPRPSNTQNSVNPKLISHSLINFVLEE